MSDIITFGEAMLRLSPPDHQRLEQSATLDLRVGGAEFNVATDLARLEAKSAWVTLLPENSLGRLMRNKAREQGVNTEHIVFSEHGRAGIYFVEFGASPRPSTVLYDRDNSSISRIAPGMLCWERIFQGASWFHTSGITPALSPAAARETETAIRVAKEMGLTVSYDLNYRAKLWTPAEAQATTRRFAHLIDICIGNEEDAEKVLGVTTSNSDAQYTHIDPESYIVIAETLVREFGFSCVATSLRESHSVQRNGWSGMLYTGGKPHFSPRYELEIVDRLGGGDAFSAGLIYALTHSMSHAEAIDFAVAFSALKQTIVSDINWTTREEVEHLLQGGCARIAR